MTMNIYSLLPTKNSKCTTPGVNSIQPQLEAGTDPRSVNVPRCWVIGYRPSSIENTLGGDETI